MNVAHHFPTSKHAMMPYPYIGLGIEEPIYAHAHPEVAAPFQRSRNVLLLEGHLRALFQRLQLNVPSTAAGWLLSVKTDFSSSELIHEFRRVSGLTWAQISDVFEVSKRAPFDWASGKEMSAKNHEKLGRAISALRFIDRGSAEENRKLLLGDAGNGQSLLDLFVSGEFDAVRAVAGGGEARPQFRAGLSPDAEFLNAPRHFGRDAEQWIEGDEEDIMPILKQGKRRVVVRRTRSMRV